MAFNLNDFSTERTIDNNNKNKINVFHVKSEDSREDILKDGYFNELNNMIKVKDFILVASSAFSEKLILVVDFVDSDIVKVEDVDLCVVKVDESKSPFKNGAICYFNGTHWIKLY